MKRKHQFLDYFNRKNIYYLVLILLLLSILPLFLLARYNHPCADDFSYGNNTVHIWRESASLWQTLLAAFEGVKQVYNSWQGTFSATFLMMLHPAVFGENLYIFVPVILILGFLAAYFYFFKVVLMDCFGMDQYGYGIITILIVFVSMQFTVSPVQAFFWYNGAIFYTGFHCFVLVLFGLVLSPKHKNMTMLALSGVLAIVFGFVIGGGNYITALSAIVVMALLTVYRMFVKKEKWILPLLSLLALCAGLLISAIAPGNANRMQYFTGESPIRSIFLSFGYALRFIREYVRFPVFIAFACIIPLIYEGAAKCNYSFRLPGLVSVILYGAFASTFTPNLYVRGSFGPARVLNINLYIFLLFLFLFLFYWCGWLAKKFTHKELTGKKNKKALKEDMVFSFGMLGVTATCFAISCFIVISLNANAMISVSAMRSLVNGEARIYQQENLARRSTYYDSKVQRVEVPAFSVKPYVLFFDDVIEDPTDWKNVALSNYYGKESVTLIP